jgi:hypothetical protein
MNWDRILTALVLVRLGQDLGSDSPVSQAVRAGIDLFLALLS